MLDIEKRCPELISLMKYEFLEPFDVEFARYILMMEEKPSKELAIASALVSRFRRDGHVCVDLKSLDVNQMIDHMDGNLSFPPVEKWKNILLQSDVVGRPGIKRPFVLDEKLRLYLYRFWKYEQDLAGAIRSRLFHDTGLLDSRFLKKLLNSLFSSDIKDEYDWQKIATAISIKKGFCAVSGGPGTGKTTLIFRIIAALCSICKKHYLNIFLLAPTGKASARMKESYSKASQNILGSYFEKVSITIESSTIHRFLIERRHKKRSGYIVDPILNPDLVVVDEASMVDLELMSKLVQALPDECRLILMGDKDQLSSVEPGAIFSDICPEDKIPLFSRSMCHYIEEITGYKLHQVSTDNNHLYDSIVNLEHSYRFAHQSGIYQLSRAVREGEPESAFSILLDDKYPDVVWRGILSIQWLYAHLRKITFEQYVPFLFQKDPVASLKQIDSFRILTALREGPYGMIALNHGIENILKRESRIDRTMEWYHGKIILITRNNYELELFNGDMGVVLKDDEVKDRLMVYFPSSDNYPRKFHFIRIPEYETAFAMTIHKSQGSEFDKVIIVLPDRETPLLTRELLYTAITRARYGVEIWGTEQVFKSAIQRKTQRISGLKDLLWE